MIKDYFSIKPDAINDIGTKFWLDEELTKYCHAKLGKDFRTYCVEDKDGYRTRLLIENQSPIYDHQQYEAFCAHIDILCLSRNHGKTNSRNTRK